MDFSLKIFFDSKTLTITGSSFNASIKIVESVNMLPRIYILLEDSIGLFYKDIKPKVGVKALISISSTESKFKFSDTLILQSIKIVQSRSLNYSISNLYSLEFTLDSNFYSDAKLYIPNTSVKEGYNVNTLGFIIKTLLSKVGFKNVYIEPTLEVTKVPTIYLDSRPIEYILALLNNYDKYLLFLNLDRKAYIGDLDFLRLHKTKIKTITSQALANFNMFDAKMILNLDYKKFMRYYFYKNYINNNMLKPQMPSPKYSKFFYNEHEDDINLNRENFENHKLIFQIPLDLSLHSGDLVRLTDFHQNINGLYYIETIVHNFDIAEQSFVLNTEISINRKELYGNI